MKYLLILIVASLFFHSCEVDKKETQDYYQPPFNLSDLDELKSKLEDIYLSLHYQNSNSMYETNESYLNIHHYIGEFGGDNIMSCVTTSNPFFTVYNYKHNPSNIYVENFYQTSFKIIGQVNHIIENVVCNELSDPRKHLLGESYFLRGFMYFNLVNSFGRPFQQNPETNLGISLKFNTDFEAIPPRATVAEVYDAIENDYLKAAGLMQLRDDYYNEELSERNTRVSKEVVWAALSRLYLYKGSGKGDDFEKKAAAYADSVILSGTYSLIQDSVEYVNYLSKYPENNIETIFAIRQIEENDPGYASVGAKYYPISEDHKGVICASEPYRELLDQNTTDWRKGFIPTQYEKNQDGTLNLDENGKPIIQNYNGYPLYNISKCSFQDDKVSLYSPVMFRLAEMYLNRAEAYAKLGYTDKAISDLNIIRSRVNIPSLQASDFSSKQQLVDKILQERRLELAFEAHRKFDIFRNNKTLARNYQGTHQADGLIIVPPEHNRVVLYLPESEILINSNLIQNP